MERKSTKEERKLVVGRNLRKKILQYFHSIPLGGHSGMIVTVNKVASVFYWKGSKKNVRNLVRECSTCQ